MSRLPADYVERVYAGVLGKMIGVYLGRPIEGWTHERIMSELGDVRDYVNDRVEHAGPIVITDDDLSGTFTFVRALEDHAAAGRDLTAEQVGRTWLNYLIENRAVLWWGGIGMSTEHTAYLRLKRGVPAPRSGSAATNGKTVAEQIGAQIFIDGWAMVAPGQPDLAAELAKRAASVSHDGEAVYAAQVIAAMESQAFVESNANVLLDTALSFIPRDCLVRRLIDDVRSWRAKSDDWRHGRALLASKYGYDRFPGACHVIPNHGVVMLAVLFGKGDFTDSLTIAATSGWDTDCNAGNVGCLLGILKGLDGIRDRWREPVNDRLYLPTADGGSSVTDAATQAVKLSNLGRALAGEAPQRPKDGARFHFSFPGSTQGFTVSPATAQIGSVDGKLRVEFGRTGHGSAHVGTATFIPPEMAPTATAYPLVAAPTLYSGQTLRATVVASGSRPTTARLSIGTYHADQIARRMGPPVELKAGAVTRLEWKLPDFNEPIATAGVTFEGSGPVDIDAITWDGEPDLTLKRPLGGGTMWRRAWVNAVQSTPDRPNEDFTLVQNEGRGLLITGTRDWRNYEVSATFTPRLAKAFGLAARVQGLRRYYAVLLCDDQKVRLIKFLDEEQVLAELPCPWALDRPNAISLSASNGRLVAMVNGRQMFDVTDPDPALACGGVALVVEDGNCFTGPVRVKPAKS